MAFVQSSQVLQIWQVSSSLSTSKKKLSRSRKMNKVALSMIIVAVLAVVLGTAGFVFAQSPTPQTPVPGSGYGTGMMNGRGARGGMTMNQGAAGMQDGLLHDAMIAVVAEKLGIPVEDLNVRLANGETMAQIATANGLTAEQLSTLMANARSQAIDQAVKAGTLTQAQADWMSQRGAGQMAAGAGGMGGGRGMHGAGKGQFTNPECPFDETHP
jgi:hypothetical protein